MCALAHRPAARSRASLREMNARRFAISLAAAAVLTACSPTPARFLAPDATPTRAAKAAGPVAAGREVRYYVDSQGMLWDDRGTNLGRPAPDP